MPTTGIVRPSAADPALSMRLVIELFVLAVVVMVWTSGVVADPDSGRSDLVETQRRMKLQWMRDVVPADATVIAWFADDSADDLMLVCRFENGEPEPAWSETMVLWNRATVPGLLVGIADQPVEVPTTDATIDAWRAFLTNSRVRVLPLDRPGALRRTTLASFPIGRSVPVDPCLD